MKKSNRVVTYLVLAMILIVALFPIYWMLNTSLKLPNEINQMRPTYWPKEASLYSYRELVDIGFLRNVYNSLLVSVITSVLSILLSMIAAYAIARLRFKLKKLVSRSIFYAYIMPRTVLYIPLYMVAAWLGLRDSIAGLILVYPTFTLPYAVWMLTAYFKTIPRELEEAAIIDGSSKLGSMTRIVFPLAAPGIIATMIFAFTFCWSEYLYALVIITDSAYKTITLGLYDLIIDDLYAWGPLMGASIIAALPVVILYFFASNYLVTGLAEGGVKG